jgi:hypothetical protein
MSGPHSVTERSSTWDWLDFVAVAGTAIALLRLLAALLTRREPGIFWFPSVSLPPRLT